MIKCSVIILQLCQRMCLLDTIADKCQCIHPLYTDFDLFKNHLEATYEMEICNLIQESKLNYYLSWYICDCFSEYSIVMNERFSS